MNALSDFFSDKYINQNAAKNNIIIYLLGRLSYPFSVVFTKIGVSPNQLTTVSTMMAILSSISLVYDSGWLLFIIFWSCSLLLDFCDGTVARMTDQVRTSAFRYDHTSDLFKIFIVILGVSVRFDDLVLWIISTSTIFFFMFYTLLNHEYSYVDKINNLIGSSAQDDDLFRDVKITLKHKLKSRLSEGVFKTILTNAYVVIFSINGHTLLVFLFFSLGVFVAKFILLYLMTLSVKGVYQNINNLRLVKQI